MSLAINREEMNEFAFQGLAIPQQYTINPGAEFYDPAWARAYADYDPERAMQLLDELGLRDVDGDGFREGPDGEPFAIQLNVQTSSDIGTIGFSLSELVTDYWREVGIKTDYKQISRELAIELRNANQLDVFASPAGNSMPTRVTGELSFFASSTGYAKKWDAWMIHQRWVQGGRIGEKPPPGVEPPEKWRRYIETGSTGSVLRTESTMCPRLCHSPLRLFSGQTRHRPSGSSANRFSTTFHIV